MKVQPAGKLSSSKITLIAVLTIVFSGIAVWMVTPAPPIGFYWDDNWYILMAEWLTPDSDYRGLSLAMMRVTSYPPLFPYFISLAGSNLFDQQNAFIMNALFLALGAGVAMLWFAREGFSSIAITMAAMLIVFNPVTLGYLAILYSEFLFIFLSTSALAIAFLGEGWKSNSKWLVIGIIVGLSVATRSAGWPLVAGFLIHLILSRRLRPAVVFAIGLAVSLLIIPFLMVGLPPPTVNYMDQLLQNMDKLGWGFLIQQLQGLVNGWFMLWGWGIGAWLAAIAVLPGLFVRLKANRVDAWFVLMYLGMLLVWPWPGHMGRFLWPLLPCFLVSAHSSFKLINNPTHRSVVVSVVLGIILAASIPDGIGRSLQRLLNPPEGELAQLSRMHEWTRSSTPEEGLMRLQERSQLLEDLQRVGEIVETNACIYSDMSALVAVHARRVSFPILWTSLETAGQTKIQCEYYYMLPESLAGTSIDDLNRFTAIHEEIFRSVAPGEPRELPLSVFLRFRPPMTQ